MLITENFEYNILEYFLKTLKEEVKDEREQEAMAFRAVVSVYETQYIKLLRYVFKRQEQEVLSKFGLKKSFINFKDFVDFYMFDRNIWDKTLTELGHKLNIKAANTNGKRVWADLQEIDKSIKLFISAGADFNMEYPETIERLEVQAIKFAVAVNETTELAIRVAIMEGFKEGETVRQIGKRISEVFDNCNKIRAELIARTESTRAANYGAISAYKQSNVVEAKEWLTAQDEKVCPFCYGMDEQVKALNENFLNNNSSLRVPALDENGKPIEGEHVTLKNTYTDVEAPPLHPRCRCTVLPVLKEI